MTGRKLYDHFTDARARHAHWGHEAEELIAVPRAWPSLHWREKDLWNSMAKAVTPKPRPKA